MASEAATAPMDTTTDSAGRETKQGKLPEYQLSATIRGPVAPVRDVSFLDENMVVVMEERGQVSVWQREGPTAWKRLDILKEPLLSGRLLFVLEHVKGAKAYPPGTFIAGGGDHVARPFTVPEGKLLEPLTGHGNVVNSITVTNKGEVVTGSWDGIARIWRGQRVHAELAGHQHATEVLALPSGDIITASANKAINIFRNNALVKTVHNAHGHALRKIIPHPFGFATCGNDGHIKVWSLEGEPLRDIPAHLEGAQFVYGLALTQEEELVSAAEDGTMKIWAPDGSLRQTVTLPGPARAVRVLPNNDIIVACSDRTARIFTKAQERVAGEEEMKKFNELVALVKASGGMKSVDPSTLPGESALMQPGRTDGEVRVVNTTERGPAAYKWEAANNTWVELEEVLGATGGGKSLGKQVVEGKEYDQVVDIYVTESQSIPLGFNRDDDPYDVAHRFCGKWGLPDYYRQQIIDYITPMCDKDLHAARVEQERRLAEATRLVHVPSWWREGFQSYTDFQGAKCRAKMGEINAAMDAAAPERLDSSELKALDGLIPALSNVQSLASGPFTRPEEKAVLKLLQWPSDKAPAVVDLVRAAMLHTTANKVLGGDPTVRERLLEHAKASNVLMALTLKALSNWIAKRERSPGERASPPRIPEDVTAFLAKVLSTCSEPAVSAGHDGLAEAFALFAHNLVCWLGRLKLDESELYGPLLHALVQLLASERKDRAAFYALLTIGSIGHVSETSKAQVLATLREPLTAVCTRYLASPTKPVQEVARDVTRVYSLNIGAGTA